MVKAGAVLEAVKAFRGPVAADELAVALVDIAGDQPRALRIGTGDEDGRNTADVGSQARRVEVADRRLGRDQDLAAEVAALLFRCELVFEVNPGDTRLDIGLHDLEAVERPAEAGFGIGDDRREPVAPS